MTPISLIAQAEEVTGREAVVGLVVFALLAGGVFAWGYCISRWNKGLAALAPEPRRAPPWRGLEVVLVIGFLVTTAYLADADVEAPQDYTISLVVSAALSLAMAGIVVAGLVFVRGATATDLGVIGRMPSDLGYGAVAWFAALPLVYALQVFLVWNMQKVDRQEHWLLTLLTNNPTAEIIVLVALVAAVVAPLVEEFLFRVLLQGWLEKVFARRETVVATVPQESVTVFEPTDVAADVLRDLWAEPALADDNPFASPGVTQPTPGILLAETVEPLPAPLPSLRAVGPIVISSAIFAGAHAHVWPDPVPLFVLALFLGYVYHQTHRLWPSVVAHMLFNSVSLLAVWAA